MCRWRLTDGAEGSAGETGDGKGEILKGVSQGGQGQADHVGERTVDAFDDPFAVFLDGVGPGFVERVDGPEVALDLAVGEAVEGDVGGFRETASEPVVQ